MPLIQGCTYQNPAGVALPPAPAAAAAPNLAPAQGDHVFGDIVGTLNNSFQLIFGGGQNMATRMRNFNATLAGLWQGFAALEFGHGAAPPLVNRNGAPEPDEHAHMHGGYSARLQWSMCEIVCTGFAMGQESRRIGGATGAWKRSVLASFDELFNNFVDDTALRFYIATPGAIRAANPGAVRHPAISVAAASTFVTATAGPGKAALQTVLNNLGTVRGNLEGFLSRFEGSTKTLNPVNDTWT